MEGREIRGFPAKFWLKSRDWREKQGPVRPPTQIPSHPLHVAFLPLRGQCFKAHETPSSSVPPAEPPERLSASPAGLAFLLPFSHFL